MGNSQSPDKLINAGDIILDEARLISYNGFELDLTKMLVSFTIYEDIFSNGLSGNIIIVDSMNLAKNIPIIGQEVIYLSFKTPGVDNINRRIKLNVFKVSAQFQSDPSKAQTLIKLELISPIISLSNRLKLNRVLNNMTYSDMVSSIFRDVKYLDSELPDLLLEQTFGKTSVVIPNWNPLYAINWMGYRSVSKKNNLYCDYVFYQDLDGFHFKSISSLKNRNDVCTYKNIPAGFRDENNSERMLEAELRSVLHHTISDVNDKLKDMVSGMYSSTQLVHEMTTKSYYVTDYSYRDYFSKIPHLNPNRIIPYDNNMQDAFKSYMKYHVKSHYSFEGVEDANYVDRSLVRQAQVNLMKAFTMSIRVFGDSTLRVGDVINLEFTTPEDRSKTGEETDRYLSGRYMIIAICHEYKQGLHEMLMTISRDSYGEPIPDKKKKEIEFI